MKSEDDIKLSDVPEDKLASVSAVYYVLATLCKGRAQCYVREAEKGNGLEAWRWLSKRFEHVDFESVYNTF